MMAVTIMGIVVFVIVYTATVVLWRRENKKNPTTTKIWVETDRVGGPFHPIGGLEMITITFGLSNSVTKDVGAYPTVNHIISCAALRQVLGFGDNVEARVNGVTADVGQELVANDNVTLITKANSKAS